MKDGKFCLWKGVREKKGLWNLAAKLRCALGMKLKCRGDGAKRAIQCFMEPRKKSGQGVMLGESSEHKTLIVGDMKKIQGPNFFKTGAESRHSSLIKKKQAQKR